MFELTDQAFARVQPLLPPTAAGEAMARPPPGSGAASCGSCTPAGATGCWCAAAWPTARPAWLGWSRWRGCAGRWCGFQQGKGETGLDHYSSAPLRRLVPARHLVNAGPGVRGRPARPRRGRHGRLSARKLAEPLVALNVPEIRRLLCLLVWPSPAEPAVAISLFSESRASAEMPRRGATLASCPRTVTISFRSDHAELGE
jgi:hypothetical protein